MSILIKGLEMPSNCDKCELCNGMGKDYGKAIYYCAPLAKWVMPNPLAETNDCPLVEVDDDELDAAFAALKGTRKAIRIITDALTAERI